jgi:hypothetical protein
MRRSIRLILGHGPTEYSVGVVANIGSEHELTPTLVHTD